MARRIKKRSSKDTVPEGLVPSSTYLGIREKDNYIIGMIDIRHCLNDFYYKRVDISVVVLENLKGKRLC